MNKIFNIKWIVLILGAAGFVLVLVAQEANVSARFSGAIVVFFSISYFLAFEKEFFVNLGAGINRRIPINSFKYRVFSFFTSLININPSLINENENNKEKARYEEFSFKFQKIYRIPIIGNLLRWAYKEGWLYSIGFFLVILLSVVLLTHNLGERNLHGDEFQVISAATSYANTGDFYKWDWIKNKPICTENTSDCKYIRAWPHTILVAHVYKLFGVSELSSRVVSVIFSLITIFILYFFTKFFTGNKAIALLSVFSLSLYPDFINLGQYTRMYAMLIPSFLALSYLFYRGLTGTTKIKPDDTGFKNFIYSNLNFDYRYLTPAFLILLLAYFIHVNIMVIAPVALIFLLYLSITKREKKYIVGVLLGVLGIIFITLVSLTVEIHSNAINFLSFFERSNSIYLEYLTKFPLPGNGGIILLLLGVVSLIFVKNKELRDRLTYLYIIIFFTLLFFIYIANRYASFVYVSHIMPISLILITSAYLFVVELIRPRIIKIVLIFFFIGGAILTLSNEINFLYGYENKQANFKIAYATIKENYNPDREVIFGQYLRTYYLKGLALDFEMIDMLSNREYAYETFLSDIKKYDAGWITWETSKGYHISRSIRTYIDENFKKIHGTGIDDTKVEIYYFSRAMIINDKENAPED